jgi:two-component system, OmpR family, alkaline phosphatase synthesis response regulator PhoP
MDTDPLGPLVTIVEDDATIAAGLALNLRLQGYRTETAGDGEEARTRIETDGPDLVLLDITLPKQSGIWVLERLREAGNHTPVIVLSARHDEFDKVAALSLGADDYVTKPFALAELLARVAALLRRVRLHLPRQGARPSSPGSDAEMVRASFGDVVIDFDTHTVVRAGHPIRLTHREFELLAFLCRSGDRVFSREELVHHVWGLEHPGQVRTVDNFIAQLRAKLEKDPERPKHLLTIRGTGYRLVVEGKGPPQ